MMQLRFVSLFLAACSTATLLAREARAACPAATPTNICVAHNGAVYTLDTGTGPVAQATVTVPVNTDVTFEMDPASAALASHPFYLTDSATGGGAGTKFTTPSVTGRQTFSSATSMALYYQCEAHANMGGRIVVGNPAEPDASTGTDAGVDASPGSDASVEAGPPDAQAGDSGAASPPPVARPDAGSSSATSSDDGGCAVGLGLPSPGGVGGAVAALALSLAALRRRRDR